MVNEQHYARLKKGVQGWNEWRAKNLGIIPNFFGADLSMVNLVGADLSIVNLSGANLNEANLSGANLNRANLSGANLSGANLSRANLSEVNLKGLDLSGANLSGVNLKGLDLRGANLSGADLSGVNLILASLSGADLSGVNLIGTNLSGTNLSEVNLIGTNLCGADLSGVYLRGANLSGADLSGTNLSGLNLSWTNLCGANLSWAELSGVNFSGADLSGVNLSGADLSGTNLSGADLSGTNLSGVNLSGADLSGTNLSGLNLKGLDLSGVNLSRAKLSRANLSGTNLSGLDLSELDLSGVNLSWANLIGAKLIRTQVLGTDFTGAKFTSAYLEDWNINSATKLDNIDCQYVYLKNDKQERCPNSGEFAPGEFTKLFQKALETVNLIFSNGIDWEAFAYSFRKIQVENEGSELAIQSIEAKGEGLVVVRVNVSPNADKANIHSDFIQGYEFAHKVLEDSYRAELSSKNTLIVHYKEDVQRQGEHINNLINLLSQQQTVQKAMADNPKKISNTNFYNPQFAGGFVDANTVDAHQIGGNIANYTHEQRQTLAEAAAEIQQLLNQLAQTNPTTDVATEVIHQKIKTDPTFKARLLAALKAGGLEALKAIFDNPLFNIPAETIKGFLEAE